jgi:hypothetical protein
VAQFHPQLRKTLLRNLSELVAAVTLARYIISTEPATLHILTLYAAACGPMSCSAT